MTVFGKAYAMIGAGAVVKRNVPDHAIMVGIPAKQKGWACKCGTTLKFNSDHAVCVYCGSDYQLNDGRLTTDAHGYKSSIPLDIIRRMFGYENKFGNECLY